MVTSSDESTGTLLSLSNNLADAVETAGRSIVAVRARRHTPASGIHWQQGIIVTADHVIEREDAINVLLPDGAWVPATVAGRDPATDLAVLRVEVAGTPAAQIGDTASLRVGHIVLAVARPGEHGVSASWGTVSAIGGAWRTGSGGSIDTLVRPDLTLYPGFSGGPLIDATGTVVGLNTSGLSRNMTLTIPTSTVSRVVEQLLTRGHIARGYLGLAMQAVQLPPAVKDQFELPTDRGLIVVSVESGGPAEAAGLIVGDVLLALDGQPVTDTEAIQSMLASDRIGQAITVRVLRGGSPTEVSLTVGERPRKAA